MSLIEKTKHISVENKMVDVEVLSLDTRKEIEFYDYLRERIVTLERDMKVLVTAHNMQKIKVSQLVKSETDKKNGNIENVSE